MLRNAQSCLRPCLAIAAWIAMHLPGAASAQQANPNPFGAEAAGSGGFLVNNIFPVAPRELRQHLTRAQAALDEERFSDAVAELGEILNSAGSDDFFLGAPGSPDAQVSLKTQAWALLGSMPAKGRRMLELQFGADAKAGLEAALEAGDLGQLTAVSRRYFHTKAGYEAALLVGRHQLDQGRPLSAALTLKRVAEVPVARSQYDPELSVLLATCWLHANQPDQATEVLRDLKRRLPQATVRLADREAPLFTRDDAALSWLEQLVGGSRLPFASAASEWTLYRGNERRNAASNDGVPLLNFQWKLPTVNDPTDERRVAEQYRVLRDRGEPLISALQPLAVQNYAIVRLPESSKLVGVNLRNGKRIGFYPPGEDSVAAQEALRAAANRGPSVNIRETELRQRVWEDNAFGQVSSDGRQVYVLDDLGYAPSNVSMPQQIVGRGGVRTANPGWARSYNSLVALDLKKQFYLQWAVGGVTGEHPALANAFFLGAPLPAGDWLYALAEFPTEIRLVCLDPRTGALEWKQQLAVLEPPFDIVNDRARRLAGASPSLADGILVCPTSAGAVVAVDLATRTLRWGYQYGRADVTTTMSRMAVRPQFVTTGGMWLDATATIANGAVILTPLESQQLHCLDLLTGKAKWKPIPRDEMLYVACVHQEKIILVGKTAVRAVNLADGKPAWSADLKLSGEAVSGRGYYSGEHYYLPTTGRQLCKIDLAEGRIIDQVQTEVELGNLVVARDQLISQHPHAVASFVLLSDALRRDLQQRLAANPDDTDALALQAQILLQENKANESLALLRRARELAPEKGQVRNLLVKVMLSLLRNDFAAHLPLAAELEGLVSDPVQRREVLRWQVQGLIHHGRMQEALAALLELADQELAQAAAGSESNEMVVIGRERTVRLDRWLAGQFRALSQAADSATASQLAREIARRETTLLSAGSPNQLRSLVTLFGGHAGLMGARLTLAEKLIASDALLEAEVVLGTILERGNAAERGSALAVQAVLYEKAKRPDLAVRCYQDLQREFGSVVCREGSTGAALAERAAADGALAPHFRTVWPYGEITMQESEATAQAQFIGFQRMAYALQITHYGGPAPRGLKATYDTQQANITVRNDLGHALGTASLRGPESQRPRLPIPHNSALSGKAWGHLLAVNAGTEVVAVDGLRADRGGADALLWRQEATDLDPTKPDFQRLYSAARMSTNPLLGSSRYLNPFFTGPLLPTGLCFQRGRQIVCVDPLSGQTLWERGSTTAAELPAQAEIFGDSEFVFVMDGKNDSRSEEALVLSPLDGALLGKRQVARAERRWTTLGRHVLLWEQAGQTVTLSLRDAWAEAGEMWAKTVARGTRGCLIDGEELALLEPGGQFTVVSLASGEVQFSVPLQAEPKLSWIHVIRSRDQYLLMASQEENSTSGVNFQPISSASNSTARLHGRVYAFSRATGKLQWPAPAFVAQQFLPADQPSESPLLVFIANRSDAQGNNNRAGTSLLVLDRRTGRSVYDGALANATMHCEIAADPLQREVKLALLSQASKTLTFTLTDAPRPPEPPAQTGPLASATAGQPRGTVDRSLGAAIELLQRGFAPPALRLPPLPPNPPPR